MLQLRVRAYQDEVQIAGRIHRLGQEKDVCVKRFVFADSYEEKVRDCGHVCTHVCMYVGQYTRVSRLSPIRTCTFMHLTT